MTGRSVHFLVCSICWTASFEPCEESECELQHPHDSMHACCQYCRLSGAYQKLHQEVQHLRKLIDQIHRDTRPPT